MRSISTSSVSYYHRRRDRTIARLAKKGTQGDDALRVHAIHPLDPIMAASISTSGTQGTGDSYWRQPHSLFEIASSYSRVYVSSELRLEGEPTCVGYNGRVVSVADGSTLRIYTLEKTYPYTKEPARVVLRGTVDFACRRFALTGRFLVGLGRERLQVVRLST